MHWSVNLEWLLLTFVLLVWVSLDEGLGAAERNLVWMLIYLKTPSMNLFCLSKSHFWLFGHNFGECTFSIPSFNYYSGFTDPVCSHVVSFVIHVSSSAIFLFCCYPCVSHLFPITGPAPMCCPVCTITWRVSTCSRNFLCAHIWVLWVYLALSYMKPTFVSSFNLLPPLDALLVLTKVATWLE